jgi:hypothetical protein
MCCIQQSGLGVMVMAFNATFNYISVICGCQFYWWGKPEYREKTTIISLLHRIQKVVQGRPRRDLMERRFTTTCEISANHLYRCEFESCSWWGVLETTICDTVCQWLAAGSRRGRPCTTFCILCNRDMIFTITQIFYYIDIFIM